MARIYSDHRCLDHRPPGDYPECPERLELILAGLDEAGRPSEEPGDHAATEEAVLALHREEYVERFRRFVEGGAPILDAPDNPLCPETWDAAWAAISATLAAADWVVAANDRHALAAVRPPGHHAERDRAMGFCFFDNIAVAAEHLRRRHGVERLAIFDFDVHHGNGTQHLFERDPEILFASTHQYPLYPGTGASSERGLGPGEGATVNVPLPAGTGDAGYAEAIDEIVLPAIAAFEPEVLLVSAGFDAWRGDPLAGMQVSEDGYRDWGRKLAAVAAEQCQGRLLATLEGGYDLEALPRLVNAFLDGLAGEG